MTKVTDWVPSARLLILAMVEAWLKIFDETVEDSDGKKVRKLTLWGIPESVYATLAQLFDAATAAIRVAMNEETRTRVSTRACKTAFDALIKEIQIRSIKRKYFFMPPLSAEDYVSLGLTLPDTTQTSTGTPTMQIRLNPYPSGGFNEVGVRLEAIIGGLRDRANKEIRVYYQIVGPGERIPESQEELTMSVTLRRKNDVLKNLPANSSGKKLVMAARAENGQDKGPWGPIVLPKVNHRWGLTDINCYVQCSQMVFKINLWDIT